MDSLVNSREVHLQTRRTTLEISVLWCALICYPQYYWIPNISTTTIAFIIQAAQSANLMLNISSIYHVCTEQIIDTPQRAESGHR